MNAPQLSLPGTPVLYYGHEIGRGDNMELGDRTGGRTPFQWSSDRNAGFSRANPQKLYLPVIIDPEYHFEAVNVETHQANPTSLLWWMKRLIAARKDHPALARGSLEILHPANKKVLVFLRTNGDERILVVANLSRYTQCVELDLSQHQGSVPEEVFGRSRFPAIGEHPYFLTLAPYGFYWLLLRPAESAAGVKDPSELRRLEVGASWRELLSERRGELENLLLEHLPRQRWFRAKARKARSARIADTIEITKSASGSVLLLVRVDFFDGEEELYALPLTASFDEEAKGVLERAPGAALAHLTVTAGQPGESAPSNGVLHDAAQSPAFAEALLACIARNKGLRGEQGQISCWTRPGALDKRPDMTELAPRPGSAEQSNTSILYGKRYILKLVRRLDFGKHPDVELTGFLDRKGFEHVPRLVGTLEYKGDGPLTACVGILSSFVPSRGDGWQLTLEMLDRYFEEALAREGGGAEPPASFGTEIIDAARTGLPEPARELLGSYLPLVRLLGRRTAEMHLALASARTDPAFAPERFSELHQRSLYQSARTRLATTMEQLQKSLPALPEALAQRARALLTRDAEIDRHLNGILERKLDAQRIRCHGDYHLGQVLYTGADFVILDFEGEPARSLNERRFKRSPLRDVAGMLRSFHYAALTALDARRATEDQKRRLHRWAERWASWTSVAFLEAYLEEVEKGGFLPAETRDREALLAFYLMEKCVYELGYELNNRPEWIAVPIAGMENLLGTDAASATRAAERSGS
jgi:maltose alpha-D-glucosyltransferase/alpha-amylase